MFFTGGAESRCLGGPGAARRGPGAAGVAEVVIIAIIIIMMIHQLRLPFGERRRAMSSRQAVRKNK